MVTMIEGDGIGPEIAQSVKDIFAAAKVSRSNASLRCSKLTANTGSDQEGISRCHASAEGRQDGHPGRSFRECYPQLRRFERSPRNPNRQRSRLAQPYPSKNVQPVRK